MMRDAISNMRSGANYKFFKFRKITVVRLKCNAFCCVYIGDNPYKLEYIHTGFWFSLH